MVQLIQSISYFRWYSWVNPGLSTSLLGALWSNDSGLVTSPSYKITGKEQEYCRFKSWVLPVSYPSAILKEQQVYDSFHVSTCLRHTLKNLKINSQVKISSNLIYRHVRLFSSETIKKPNLNIDSWFVTGFISFFLIFFFNY